MLTLVGWACVGESARSATPLSEENHSTAASLLGCYMIKLPRVSNPPPLEESKKMCKGKLQACNDGTASYIILDHDEFVPSGELFNSYYLPVHGVLKEELTTTKVCPIIEAIGPETVTRQEVIKEKKVH